MILHFPMIKGSQVESNRSTMSYINTLINVGLGFQPCHSPTKGVNVAVSLLFTFTAETTHTCFSVEMYSFEKIHISLAYRKGCFSRLCHRPFESRQSRHIPFYHFLYKDKLETSEQKLGQTSYSPFRNQFGCYVLFCVCQDIL